MKQQRIYIDTSVIGGYYDTKFETETRLLFKRIADKEFDAVAFFRAVKEKMAKATEGMSLQEKRNYWKLIREGKVKLA